MNNFFVDLSWHALNKHGEELCGDTVEVVQDETRTIVVLADGMGSGVKANILSTLTAKIMSTMLKNGADLKDTIDTITGTLPICNIRKIGYSTFTIAEIDHMTMRARVIEFDNPPVILTRNHRIVTLEKKNFESSGKKVWLSEIALVVGDELTLCSDGVIHAGVGMMLNHGWEWVHVAEFLKVQNLASAEKLNRRLIETCHRLYDGRPGDDTTAVTIKIRRPQWVNLLTGPPIEKASDHMVVEKFMRQTGMKIVCGGTAANMVARELQRDLITNLVYEEKGVPPIAAIKGIDLVTEGVLTLKMTLDRLKELNCRIVEPDLSKKDGVTRLLKLFIEDATHIVFWVGRAVNPAHQNPDFPSELIIKLGVVKELVQELSKMGKPAVLQYTDR